MLFGSYVLVCVSVFLEVVGVPGGTAIIVLVASVLGNMVSDKLGSLVLERDVLLDSRGLGELSQPSSS